ncbi:MAG: ferritin-like domain-containing protein [Actinomycetota bacterium]|nr:ferritin-like domain-containing protein [Actinomycetota bacterium]
MDVMDFARSSRPVEVDDLDLEHAFDDSPLSAETLRCLRYMADIESHTVCYLRDLLLTESHRDPRVTMFLTTWAWEEQWHGIALGRVLAAHGMESGDERVAAVRSGLGFKDRLGPLLTTVGSVLARKDFVAVHMTWGALNEWSTQCGYSRLAELEGHPVLSELLERINRQEARHIAFYATEARARLAESPRARRLVRFALDKLWAPVGAGVVPKEETAFLVQHLLSGEEGDKTVASLDARLHRLPGMEGLGLVTREVARWREVPTGPSLAVPLRTAA